LRGANTLAYCVSLEPAGDPDGVEFGPKGVAVSVGVPVELVVVLVPRPDLLAAGVKRVGVQLLLHV
jgi:hypothetical protein